MGEPAFAAERVALPRRLLWRPRAFLDRYVFPDGELVRTEEIIARAEGAGLETRDVESLREHYAMTLRHWVRAMISSVRASSPSGKT